MKNNIIKDDLMNQQIYHLVSQLLSEIKANSFSANTFAK